MFLGMLGTATDGTFFVVAPSEGTPSKWVRIGDTIDGYIVADYKPTEEQLVLRKDAKNLILQLKKSKIRAENPILTEAAIREMAKQIVAKWDGWDLARSELIIWYKRDWNIAATRLIDGKKETRIISAPDGFAVSAPVPDQ